MTSQLHLADFQTTAWGPAGRVLLRSQEKLCPPEIFHMQSNYTVPESRCLEADDHRARGFQRLKNVENETRKRREWGYIAGPTDTGRRQQEWGE